MKPGKLNAHLHPKFAVEIGEWLVEKKNLRFPYNRAADRDTLALSTRKVLWPPMQERRQLQNLRCASHAFLNFMFGTLRHPQTEAHVLLDIHVRIESIRLKHHRDPAACRILVIDFPVPDPYLAFARFIQTGNNPQ